MSKSALFFMFHIVLAGSTLPALARIDDYKSGGGTSVSIVVTNNCSFDVEITACAFTGPTAERNCQSGSISQSGTASFDFYVNPGEYFDHNVMYQPR